MNTTSTIAGFDQLNEGTTGLEAASLLRQVLDTATEGIVAIDADYRIILASRAFLELIGEIEDKVLEACCYEVMPGSQCDTDACPMRRVMAGERRLQVEVCKQDSRGGQLHCRVTATPLLNLDGEAVGMVQEFHDLEGVRLFEQNLEIKSRHLEAREATLKEQRVALRQVVLQVDAERRDTEKKIAETIERFVVPLVQQARAKADSNTSAILDLVEKSLTELVSPLVDDKDRRFVSLSPRELEICHLIRQGLQSKEIARLFSTAEGTVEQQRKKIRRKLNLKGSGRNLVAYLQNR
jgi:PAS domain S-box-containing protein